MTTRFHERPVFIVGSPRSGTTLMRSIIDAHPNVFCPPWETGIFVQLAAIMDGDLRIVLNDKRVPFPASRQDLIDWAARMVDDLFWTLGKDTGKRRWAEKTPAHVFHMDLIRDVFPKAQFVHIIRDGMAVVRSLQNMPWAPRNIGWSTKRWLESVQAGRELGASLPKDQYHEVRYETLLSDPRETVQAICDFIGEPFAEQMLAFDRPSNNSWGATQQALQDKPVNKHRALGPVERTLFRWKAGWLQRELGY
jgi:hypothetical protein